LLIFFTLTVKNYPIVLRYRHMVISSLVQWCTCRLPKRWRSNTSRKGS